MMHSMTKEERSEKALHHQLKRKRHIATGSSTRVEDVEQAAQAV